MSYSAVVYCLIEAAYATIHRYSYTRFDLLIFDSLHCSLPISSHLACVRTEVPHPGNVRYEINDLYPDNYHMVQLRAHNNLGLSEISFVVVKTAKGQLL